jgi:hypothetical protein
MWHEYFAGLFAKAGGYLTAALGGLAAILAAVLYHFRRVAKAEDQGEKTGAERERNRIREETEVQSRETKQRTEERAEEIRRDTADPDDLLERLRDSATDSPRRR